MRPIKCLSCGVLCVPRWDGICPKCNGLAAPAEPAGGTDEQVALQLEHRAESAERALEAIFHRMEARTNHRVVCNANHSKPIGGDMCICVPVEYRALTKKLELAQAELAGSRRIVEELKGELTTQAERITVLEKILHRHNAECDRVGAMNWKLYDSALAQSTGKEGGA